MFIVAFVGSACAHAVPRQVTRPAASEISVRLHNHDLTLHLSPPRRDAQVLLVYATGDAGWWGKDRDLYSHVTSWGYATVGFSAREYVHHLGKSPMRPRDVASDYAVIIKAASTALHLGTSTRTVLIGKSRGAGLAVAAAGPELLKSQLAGVMAVALTREEEYVHRRLRRSRPNTLVMLETYSYLPQLAEVPVAVIQSTRDNYVPADEARRLFGGDSPTRELIPIDARDHNFGGALALLYHEMERSLQWLLHR